MSNIKKHSKEFERNAPNMRLCRMCTIPVQRPCTIIRHPILQVDMNPEEIKQKLIEANKENKGNYDEPILNTVLTVTRQMHDLQLDRPRKRISNMDNLTPRSKAIVIPKISQKLNFPHNKTVFRNLIPINVNDCNLLPKKPQSLRKKYIKSNNRAPTPDLADFLDPLPPLEHFIREPNIDLIYDPTDIDTFAEFYDFYQHTNPRYIDNSWRY